MRVLRQILLVATCLLVVLSLIEARFPALDSLTTLQPHPLRAIVAGLAMRELGPADNGVDRILKLDPGNAPAWERRCTAAIGPSPAISVSDCERAYALDPTAANLRAVASAQESDNRPCEAEDNYRKALSKPDLAVRKPLGLRDESRAALACGHAESALQALQQAELFDLQNTSSLQNTSALERDPTQAAVRDSLASDHGYMAVVFERINQPEKARQMCTEANPGSPGCSCELTGNALICSQATTYTIASR
jgi:hypothetical protein